MRMTLDTFPNTIHNKNTPATKFPVAGVNRLLFDFEFLSELTEDRSVKDANKRPAPDERAHRVAS